MEQHPVPQDVTGFQFKLIGDMTVKQFVYLAAGTLLAYFLTRTGWPSIFKWPAVGLAFLSGFGLAFMPIEERPLDRWVINFFRSSYLPTIFVWKKEAVIPEVLKTSFTVTSVASGKPAPVAGNRQDLTEYLNSLPLETFSPLDEEEKKRLEYIKNEFKGQTEVNAIAAPIPLEEVALAGVRDRDGDEGLTLAWAAKVSPGIAIPTSSGLRVIPRVGKISPHALGPKPKPKEETAQVLPKQEAKPKPQDIKPEEKEEAAPTYKPGAYTEPQAVHKNIPKPQDQPKTEDNKPAKTSGGEIDSLKKQLTDLQNKQKNVQGEEAEKLSQELKSLEEKFAQTLSSNRELQKQLDQIRSESKAKNSENVVVPTQTLEVEKKEATTVKFVPSQMAAQIGVPQSTSPNIISGIIKDSAGEILTSILIEVQDRSGNPVRALKTNRLGQFAVATPLENGTYTVHFEDIRNIHQFDIIEISLDGKIFPAMEVRAKSQNDAEREKLKEALFGKQN
ncbi:MAG: PrgI family protein [Patescibacteria group bacterium]|nr:PrgI family protein [Patescibacteria group bacterium]